VLALAAIVVCFGILTSFSSNFNPGLASASASASASRTEINQSLLVQLEPGVTSLQLRKIANPAPAEIEPLWRERGIYRITLESEIKRRLLLAELGTSPGIRAASVDRIAAVAISPDPLGPAQWHLSGLNRELAWNAGDRGSGAIIGMIDTGVSFNHEDLNENIWLNPAPSSDPSYPNDWYGWDFSDGDNNPGEQNGSEHGTMMSGISAAVSENGLGGRGLAPRAKIMPLRAGVGASGISISAATEAIGYGYKRGARIFNMSFVYFDSGPGDQVFRNAIAGAKDAVFLASAGNDGLLLNNSAATRAYPCQYSLKNILCLAGTNSARSLASWSNYGVSAVDLAAPGQSLAGATRPGNLYAAVTGTSPAAAYASAVAALIYNQRPLASGSWVRSRLIETASASATLSGRLISPAIVSPSAALGLGPAQPPETTVTITPGLNYLERVLIARSSEPGEENRFECRLDSGAWGRCDAGAKTFSDLSIGSHLAEARAINDAGFVDPSPAAASFQITAGPPAPTLLSSSVNLERGRARLSWASSGALSQADCRIVPENWASCSSPTFFSNLKPGPLTFELSLLGPGGRAPLEQVNLLVPALAQINSSRVRSSIPSRAELRRNPNQRARFQIIFSADEVGADFVCSLNGAPSSPCQSPLELNSLPSGWHRLSVSALGRAGIGPEKLIEFVSGVNFAETAEIDFSLPRSGRRSLQIKLINLGRREKARVCLATAPGLRLLGSSCQRISIRTRATARFRVAARAAGEYRATARLAVPGQEPIQRQINITYVK